jgi:hypothetical protein
LAECRENLEWLAVLIRATQERIDYEGSIDWFCFDPECRYQLKPGEPVFYNQSEAGIEQWQRTGRRAGLRGSIAWNLVARPLQSNTIQLFAKTKRLRTPDGFAL